MPTFFPKMPATLAISFSVPSLARGYWLVCVVRAPPPAQACGAGLRLNGRGRPFPHELFMLLFAERLDLDIHTCRKIEFHEGIDSLRRRLENIEQPLVGANLECLARLLVHVWRPQHAVFVLHRRQRNRSRDLRPCPPGRLDNLPRRLIEDAIVVCLEADANSLFSNHVFTLLPFQLIWKERSGGKLQAAN